MEHAIEQAKRRGHQALLLVGGAVAAWQAVQAERDAAVRLAQRSQEVHAALGRAAALREQARASKDMGKWAKAQDEAHSL